ncbi:SRPBCC domain-containing protein [Sphingomonas panacisoli]|uniref:SRPBCC domain-containing protein n=2 Tax=Sphingomonas panacisoli TaxID=1813879 RepID=A0A5B8LLW1_9SPHN|nr:SRPBCC domain-containing protein [Sphingomonas panacisoli]
MRDIAAAPDRVFNAWLDPAQARRFLFATPDGEMLACDIDARVGGVALIVERRGDREAHHHLRFEEIDRPHRLVFQFRACMAGQTDQGEWTRVTIAIAPTDNGSRLTLTHEGVWTDYEKQTRQGWTMILGNLADTVENSND